MMDEWSFDLSELGPEVAAFTGDIGGDILAGMQFDAGSDWGSQVDPNTFNFSDYKFDDIDNILAQIDPASLGDFVADLGLAGSDLESVLDLGGGTGFLTGASDMGASVDSVLRNYSPEELDAMLQQDLGWSMGAEGRYGSQDLGAQGTLNDKGELVIGGYDRPGGYTSQWQTTPSGERVFLNDESGYFEGKPVDQTGIAVGKDGSTRALTTSQIQDMIKKGELNTFKSGYFGATGGTKIAPGGGITTTKDGITYVLKPDGNVYKTDDGKVVKDTKTITEIIKQIQQTGGAGGVSTKPGTNQNLLGSLLPLLLMMMAMRDKGGSSGASNAVIPALTATQKQTPYTQQQQAPGYRPGQGGITYFNPVQYAPRMAGGGIVDLARMLAAQRMAKGGQGRLLQGKGDGVSDDIPAMIGSNQPARLARGEYVVDARTVAELGNGSTDAGAERLDEMRKRVHAKRKKAGVGQDSKAYKHLPA